MYCTCDIPMTGPGFAGACMNCARLIYEITDERYSLTPKGWCEALGLPDALSR